MRFGGNTINHALWKGGAGVEHGLPSKSWCINKISRWSMNEFTAGSAVITHGSARSKSLACVKTVEGGDHILRSCVCSVARRGSGCGGWPNEDAALCHEWKQQQQWKQLLAFQRKESTALFLWMFEPVSSPGLNTVQKTVWRRLIAPVNL